MFAPPDPRICTTNFISWIGGQGVAVGLAVGEAKARITRTAMIAITGSRADLIVGDRVFIIAYRLARRVLVRKHKVGLQPPVLKSITLGFDLISDALPFGRLWYAEPDAISNAIGYAKTAGGHDRAAGEVKLVYAKNTKWLLFGPYQRQKFAQ